MWSAGVAGLSIELVNQSGKAILLEMKRIVSILTLLFVLTATEGCRPRVKDIDGVEYVRVRRGTSGTPQKPGEAALWQRVGEESATNATYIQLLGWNPPKFVRTQ